jgi:hypothetical protein
VKFSLVVGIKNKNTGNILYKDISYTGWTFDSDNSAVTKTDDSSFTAGEDFYSDAPANIYIEASYKNLTKTFSFILNSFVEKPGVTPLEGTWLQPDLLNGDNIWIFHGNQLSIQVAGYTYTAACMYNSLDGTITINKLSGSGPYNGMEMGTMPIVKINDNHLTLKKNSVNHLYKQGYIASFNLDGTWECILIDDYDRASVFAIYTLTFNNNIFTCKKDGSVISQGTFTFDDTHITFSTPLVPPYNDYNIPYIKIGGGGAFKLVYNIISDNALFYKE